MSRPIRESGRRIASIARKEVRQLLRDQLTLGFVVGVPLVQLLLFGYAINQDVRHIPTAVVDHADAYVSRLFLGQLEATQAFDIGVRLGSELEAREAVRAGRVRAAVVIPADFARSYYRGRGAEVLVLVDASDPTLARAARVAANGVARSHNERQARFEVDRDGATRVPSDRPRFGVTPELVRPQFVEFSVLNLFNPELRTPVFVVPALLGVILTTTMILMTALSLVRERERGTFEFLIATPVRRGELMVGKLAPYVAIGLLQIVLVVATGLLLFRIPARGSLLELGIGALFFISANLTLGLVISSVTTSQFQATQLSFFVFLPSVLLSGFMFPFAAMPAPARWLGEMLPLTHFVRIARGVLLRGSGLAEMWIDVLALAVFTAVGFVVASRLFRKRLS